MGLAENVAIKILEEIEPELHKALIERIIDVSLEKWMLRFTHDQLISDMISDAIVKAMADKYKPVLDYIADRKAREKVMRRAEQNGIKRDEVEQLILNIGVK